MAKKGTGAPVPEPPPPVTPPPTPSGTIIASSEFDGNFGGFASGVVQLDTHVGASVQFGNYGTTGYANAFFDTNNPGHGTHYMRVDHPATSNPGAGGEALMWRMIRLGVRDFYGFMVRFPTNWVMPSFWGGAFMQLNYAGLQNHNWGLFGYGDRVYAILCTGQITRSGPAPNYPSVTFEYDNAPPRSDYPTGGPQPRMEAIPATRFGSYLGQWHKMILDIKWSTTWTGHTRIYHKLPGESAWTKTVEQINIPTVAWGPGIYWPSDPNHYMNVNGTALATGAEWRTTDKVGFYRGASTTPLSFGHDRWCKGTTFDIVAARLDS